MKPRTDFASLTTGRFAKWIVLAIWLIAAVALSVLLPSIGDEAVNNARQLGDSRPSVQAEAVATREFAHAEAVPALFVWHRPSGLTDADLLRVQAFAERLTARPAPYQTFVPPLHQTPLPEVKIKLSKDGSTFILPVSFSKKAEAKQLAESIGYAKGEAVAAFGSDPFGVDTGSPNGLSARVTGPAGIQADAAGLFGQADKPVLIGTVLLVLALLLLIYRSPILAFIPLAAVGAAYSVISPLLGWMAGNGWITVEKQGINIMTVLLFGAGTDYCLFLISRFRQLLKRDHDKSAALRSAIAGSLGAVAMSGLTVILALLTLLAAEYGSFQRFAAPFGIAILIMGLASLTLVPALLAIIGRVSFWPVIPRSPETSSERGGRPPAKEAAPQSRFGSVVVRRPRTIVGITLVVLGGLAAFASQITFTYDRLSSFPKDTASREGFAVIEEQFPPGALAPVQIIVDTQGKAAAAGLSFAKLPYVAQVSAPQFGKSNPQLAAYEVQLRMNPYSTEAMKLIPELHRYVEEELRRIGVAEPADRLWIAGPTAEQFDTKAATERDMSIVFPMIVGLIALLLLAYLRSLIAAAYLMLSVILSYGSALGLGWLVLHYLLGVDAIQGGIPLYAFVFLVALGEDYNIFVVSSIWRKIKRLPLKQAVAEGVAETGAVITSAGLILAGTFAVLANMPIQMLMQMGVITALGVLLDTFVVRPLLVPAITLLLGKWAFWPGRLGTATERLLEKSADHGI